MDPDPGDPKRPDQQHMVYSVKLPRSRIDPKFGIVSAMKRRQAKENVLQIHLFTLKSVKI